MEMAESVLLEKSKDLAVEVVLLCRTIAAEHREYILTKQLTRAITSVGANLHESKYARGRVDFGNKMQIALKECYESEYWLELLHRCGFIEKERYEALRNQCGQIRRMLIASINTLEKKQ